MEDLRKLAAEVVGKAALEEWFGEKRLSALDQVTLHKLASADQELLAVAASFGSENILKVYEELGGQYKDAGIGGSLAQGAGKLLGQAALHPGAATAIGAGVGAAGGAIAGGEGHRLSGALGGAAVGGALGAGGSYAAHKGLTGVAQKAIAHPGIMADAAKVHPGAPGMLRAVANKPWIGGAAHMEQAGQVAQGTSVARQMAGQNKGLGY
jgi:hypothetical protein